MKKLHQAIAILFVIFSAIVFTSCERVDLYSLLLNKNNPDASITSFTFASPPAVGTISGTNISVTLPSGATVTSLVPTIVHTGVSISPDSGVSQNFAGTVTYTVTAADGSTQQYYVTVTVSPSPYIVTFDSMGADTAPNPTTKTIVPPATTIDALPTPPAKAGYDFAGWNIASNGCGAEFNAGTPVTGNIIVYAVWSTAGLVFTPISGTECSVEKGSSSPTVNIIIPGTWQGRSVTTIATNGFANYTTMTGVMIPESVHTIGYNAFDSCTGLTSVTIPNSVTAIMNYAFKGSGLTIVTIPNGVTSIAEGAFNDCAALAVVNIPDSVINIGPGAFGFCSALNTLTIPANVTTIGYEAFMDSGLTSLSMESMSPPALGIDVFSGVSGCDLYIHTGTSGYKTVLPWSDTGIFTISEDF